MNQTQFQSFWKQLKEPLKQQWGKITDQDLTGIEGNESRFSTMVEARYPQQKDEVLTMGEPPPCPLVRMV